jgi:tryptophanase
MRTIIEPFKIKSVEPIHFTTAEQRAGLLHEAHYNPFLLKAKDVIIDLLTDSGTGAMSSEQWAGIMRGDESYAGSDSFFRFETAVRELTAMSYIIPVHQGRAAEKILFTIKGGKGKFVLSNTLFDTTRANIEFSGAVGVDLLTADSKHTSVAAPFKGNMDTERLKDFIAQTGAQNISLVILTVTNNSGGGQPVSMANVKAVKAICAQYHIPFFIDACRFAENCYFIKQREQGYENHTILQIAQELFGYADGCTMSAKKDAFANIGGFLAVNDEKLAEECRNLLIITEGFPTYGGLAGRDLEAIAIGLNEIVQEDYLKYRIRSIEYIGEKLDQYNIPYLKPTGGHAIYLDAKAFLPHIPVSEFPGQALCAALYLEGGIRGVEIGSVMFGKHAQQELVRLAIPRRTYTQSHMDYLAEVIIDVFNKREEIKGMKIIYETPYLRHFTARFEMTH